MRIQNQIRFLKRSSVCSSVILRGNKILSPCKKFPLKKKVAIQLLLLQKYPAEDFLIPKILHAFLKSPQRR